jgi:hypothetical protein
MFPVMYELDSYILFRRNPFFKWLSNRQIMIRPINLHKRQLMIHTKFQTKIRVGAIPLFYIICEHELNKRCFSKTWNIRKF